MNTRSCLTSACRYCRFYTPRGRRGGSCEQLNVPVEASWKACSLALPPFASAWESLEEIMKLESALHHQVSSPPRSSSSDSESDSQVVTA